MRTKVRPFERVLVALGTFFVAVGFIDLALVVRTARALDLGNVISVLSVTGLGLGLIRRGARSGLTILICVAVAAVACGLLVTFGQR